MSPRAQGALITLEGGEGAGKSTVLRVLRARLEKAGREVLLTREPGGTPLGERLRATLLDPAGDAPVATAEALLFCAARSQLVSEVIRPALARGAVILCDRYADSTLAYQGFGRGLPLETLRGLNAVATDGLTPDLTLLLDVPVAEGMARRRDDEAALDRLDQEATDFHERVRAGFRALAAAEPERWTVLDARRSPETVAEAAWEAVSQRLAEAAVRPPSRGDEPSPAAPGQAPGATASSPDSTSASLENRP